MMGRHRASISFFLPPQNWHRRLLAFALSALLIALPFSAVPLIHQLQNLKSAVFGHALSGASALQEWKNDIAALDIASAQHNIQRATDELTRANQYVNSVHAGLATLAATNGTSLLRAATLTAELGTHVTDLLARVAPSGFVSGESVLTHLPEIHTALSQIIPLQKQIASLLDSVDEQSLPSEHRVSFRSLRGALSDTEDTLGVARDITSLLVYTLGHDHPRRYLLAFQNDWERRATGGFVGSFALVDIDRGTIQKIVFPPGGSYDLQGFQQLRLSSPRALQPINPRWEFQDVNWFPDFPTSAQKLAQFYEKSGGSSVDGVIALNASFFATLLGVLGPVEMPRYGVTLTEKNFIEETTRQVETLYDRTENKPKQFLSDSIPLILSRLEHMSESQSIALLRTLVAGVSKRDLQLFITKPSEQQKLSHLGLSGELIKTDGDYLSIVDSNVGGNKSDGAVHMRVSQTVTFRGREHGETVVRLERIHTAISSNEFLGGKNRSYIRFYVPRGSTLVSAKGFTPLSELSLRKASDDLTADPDVLNSENTPLLDPWGNFLLAGEESGKTTFGGIVDTYPGSTSISEIRYQLPFTSDMIADKGYTLYLQRPSASRISEYALRILPPFQRSIKWHYPKEAQLMGNRIDWRSTSFSADTLFAFSH